MQTHAAILKGHTIFHLGCYNVAARELHGGEEGCTLNHRDQSYASEIKTMYHERKGDLL